MTKKPSKQPPQPPKKTPQRKTAEIPREAEVVVFDDPTRRAPKRGFDEGGSRQGKVAPAGKKTAAKAPLDLAELDGNSSRMITERLLREVEEFNASHLEGNDRKKHVRERMQELGALAPKPEKVPYKILKGMRAKGKFREKITREKQIENGTYVKKRKEKVRGQGNEPRDLKMRGSRFVNGVLHISKKNLV